MEDETVMETVIKWLIHYGSITIIAFAVAWIFTYFGSRFIKGLIQKSISVNSYSTPEDAQQREDTLLGILVGTYKGFVWLMASLIYLTIIGIPIGPLIAGAGILGLAIGFGAQGMITNIMSGISIIIENQYRVGDTIALNDEIAKNDGITGIVQRINFRTTVLRDSDGNLHYIPNGEIRLSTNKSMDYSKINLNVGISYDEDVDKVAKIINEVGKNLSKDSKYKDITIEAPYFVRIDKFTDNAVELKISGKVHAGEQWRVTGELRARLKKAFEQKGINVPYPQLIVRETHREDGTASKKRKSS